MQPLSDGNDQPVFKRVYLEQLGGLKAVCERLPDVPAVYAFVRNIPSPPVHDVKAFLASVHQSISMKAAPDHHANFGPLHKAVLESHSQLSDKKASDLETYAVNATFREMVKKVFEDAAVLQAPLYVGKTVSLQTRFSQHIRPMSDLNCRLREAGITLNQCILLYTEFESLPDDVNKDALDLVEEILTRLLRPGFVKRVG